MRSRPAPASRANSASSAAKNGLDTPFEMDQKVSPDERGRMAWQKASGYTKRARAETAISRYKRVIGDGLRSHTDERRATEMDVAVHVLNRMLDLGRPTYVRIV